MIWLAITIVYLWLWAFLLLNNSLNEPCLQGNKFLITIFWPVLPIYIAAVMVWALIKEFNPFRD